MRVRGRGAEPARGGEKGQDLRQDQLLLFIQPGRGERRRRDALREQVAVREPFVGAELRHAHRISRWHAPHRPVRGPGHPAGGRALLRLPVHGRGGDGGPEEGGGARGLDGRRVGGRERQQRPRRARLRRVRGGGARAEGAWKEAQGGAEALGVT